MVNERALLADLVDAIQVWSTSSKSRTLSGLARRTSVAYSTIRRIAQGESAPHPYTALAISEVVMSTQQRLLFLKTHFPTIGNLMDECYVKAIRQEPSDETLQRFIRQEPHNKIFNIAATKQGTTRKAVGALAGKAGLDALDEMLDDALLHELPSGTIKYTHDNWAIGNIELALDQVKHSTEHFDKHLVGTEGASLMHSTGAVKPELLPKVKELVMKFMKDLNELKDHEDSEGGVHFFCDLMYSLYDR
ncbi:MAG: hypothetical protein EOP04_28465, partial [Proteobacteria bacterium]